MAVDIVLQLRALDKHLTEQWGTPGYPIIERAADEIERLRSLVRELRPFVEQDVESALKVGPFDEGHDQGSCEDCQWYARALMWQERIELGELDV